MWAHSIPTRALEDIEQRIKERRERIATHILSALLSQPNSWSFREAAVEAIQAADALISELDKPKS